MMLPEKQNAQTNAYKHDKVDAFFGPVCDYSMAPIARQAKYWELPVITSGAMARDYSEQKYRFFNTLTRVGSRYDTLIDLLAVVFKHYGYSKVSLLYDPDGQGYILDKLCHLMMDGIHNAYNSERYNISNIANKVHDVSNIEQILRDAIGAKYGALQLRDKLHLCEQLSSL